jgi:tetratricopeptide (TPR) repeat protein
MTELDNEHNWTWYSDRGYDCYKNADYDEALKNINTALRLSHQMDPLSLYLRAEICFGRKQYAAALDDYNKVIQMEKELPPTYFDKEFLADMRDKKKRCQRFLKNQEAEGLPGQQALDFD